MRRLPATRIASLVLVALAVVVWVGGDASAEAPLKQGWWSRWQQDPLPGVSLTLPPPSTASGGLTVARDPTQVTAVAALYFQAPVGADVSLYLAAADAVGVRTPPNTGAVVQACPATSPWEGELNGPWKRAPIWSDDFCEPGTVVPGDAGITWTLPSTMQDEDGVYDIVIVPRGQAPYVVNLRATGEETFVVGETPPTTEATTTTTTTEPEETTTTTSTTEPIVEETEPFVITDIPPTGGSTGFPVVTTAVPPAPPRTQTSLVAFEPLRPRLPGLPDTRAERIMAVSVLFFMAVALWWLGGNPARMPRLIGALAGGGAVVAAPPPARGVGRFARARDEVRPPRL